MKSDIFSNKLNSNNINEIEETSCNSIPIEEILLNDISNNRKHLETTLKDNVKPTYQIISVLEDAKSLFRCLALLEYGNEEMHL